MTTVVLPTGAEVVPDGPAGIVEGIDDDDAAGGSALSPDCSAPLLAVVEAFEICGAPLAVSCSEPPPPPPMIGIVTIVGWAGICDALPRSTVCVPYVITAVPRLLLLMLLPLGTGTGTCTGCVYVKVTGWLAQAVLHTDVTVVTGAWGPVTHGTVIVSVTGALQDGSVQTVVIVVTVLVTDAAGDDWCTFWDDEPEDEDGALVVWEVEMVPEVDNAVLDEVGLFDGELG